MLADLIEGLGLNLTNTFTSNREYFAYFFKRMGYAISKAETHVENLLFAGREIGNNFIDIRFQYLASS